MFCFLYFGAFFRQNHAKSRQNASLRGHRDRCSSYFFARRSETRARIEGFVPFYSCSFCLQYGFERSPYCIVRTNAMLALGGICNFSAKDITHFFDGVFLINKACLFSYSRLTSRIIFAIMNAKVKCFSITWESCFMKKKAAHLPLTEIACHFEIGLEVKEKRYEA